VDAEPEDDPGESAYADDSRNAATFGACGSRPDRYPIPDRRADDDTSGGRPFE